MKENPPGLNPDEAARLIDALRGMMRALLDHGPTPVVIKDHSSDKAIDFHVTDLVQYPRKSAMKPSARPSTTIIIRAWKRRLIRRGP